MHNDNEDRKIIISLDKPLREALSTQKNYLVKLKNIITLLDQDDDLDEEGATHLYQLVLQHRLDKESVIRNLMRSNKQLCLAIGLEEHGTLKHNMDMLITQLGTDNFFKELSLLSHLVEKLNKALALTEKTKLIQKQEKKYFDNILKKMKQLYNGKTKASNVDLYLEQCSLDKDETSKSYNDKLADELRFAAGLQAYFSKSISHLSDAYHDMPNLPKFGIVYDYLVTLKGPFSDILLMLREGIQLTDQVVSILSNKLGIAPQKTVNQLFHQTNLELENFYLKQKTLQHEYAVHKNDLEQMSKQLNAEIDAEASIHLNIKKAPMPEPNSAWKKKAFNLFNRS